MPLHHVTSVSPPLWRICHIVPCVLISCTACFSPCISHSLRSRLCLISFIFMDSLSGAETSRGSPIPLLFFGGMSWATLPASLVAMGTDVMELWSREEDGSHLCTSWPCPEFNGPSRALHAVSLPPSASGMQGTQRKAPRPRGWGSHRGQEGAWAP